MQTSGGLGGKTPRYIWDNPRFSPVIEQTSFQSTVSGPQGPNKVNNLWKAERRQQNTKMILSPPESVYLDLSFQLWRKERKGIHADRGGMALTGS